MRLILLSILVCFGLNGYSQSEQSIINSDLHFIYDSIHPGFSKRDYTHYSSVLYINQHSFPKMEYDSSHTKNLLNVYQDHPFYQGLVPRGALCVTYKGFSLEEGGSIRMYYHFERYVTRTYHEMGWGYYDYAYCFNPEVERWEKVELIQDRRLMRNKK